MLHLVFQAALFAAPYKSDFLKSLSKGRDVKEEECFEKIRKFLINFSATVDAIYDMYSKMHADLDYTVWLWACPEEIHLVYRVIYILQLWKLARLPAGEHLYHSVVTLEIFVHF